MNKDILIWLIFFLIMIPSNILFNYWYSKNENSSRIVSFAVGFVIGVVSMFISICIMGGIK